MTLSLIPYDRNVLIMTLSLIPYDRNVVIMTLSLIPYDRNMVIHNINASDDSDRVNSYVNYLFNSELDLKI